MKPLTIIVIGMALGLVAIAGVGIFKNLLQKELGAEFYELLGYANIRYEGDRKNTNVNYEEPKNKVEYNSVDPNRQASLYTTNPRETTPDDRKDLSSKNEIQGRAQDGQQNTYSGDRMEVYQAKNEVGTSPVMTETEFGTRYGIQELLLKEKSGKSSQLMKIEKIAKSSPGKSYTIDSYLQLVGKLEKYMHSKDCTWTYNVRQNDTNGDQKPEFIEVKATGVCQTDKNNDSNPEWLLNIGIHAWLYNNNSDEKFDVLIGIVGARETIDKNSDSIPEYIAIGGFNGEVRDESPNDGTFEFVELALNVRQDVDANQSGTPEFKRYFSANITIEDPSSNGVIEHLKLDAMVDELYSTKDTSSYDYEMHAKVYVEANDTLDTGEITDAIISIVGYDIYDENLDKNPEVLRALSITIEAKDSTNNGVADTLKIQFGALAVIDEDSNGKIESLAAIFARLYGVDANRDDAPEHVEMEFLAVDGTDKNEDNITERVIVGYAKVELNDTNSNGVFEDGGFVRVVYAGKDSNSNGIKEYEGIYLENATFRDTNDDGNPEQVFWAQLIGEHNDTNEDGNYEIQRALYRDVILRDSNSNGVYENVTAHVAYYESEDSNSDGTEDSVYIKLIVYNGEDMDEDGFIDVETIAVYEYRK